MTRLWRRYSKGGAIRSRRPCFRRHLLEPRLTGPDVSRSDRRAPDGMEARRMPALLEVGQLRLARIDAPGDHRRQPFLAHGGVEGLPMRAEAGAGIAGAAPQLLETAQGLAALGQI